MLNCKHMIKADDLPKTVMMSAGPPTCPWCEIDRLKADLATFGNDTVATENRIIDAEFDAQALRVSGEAFRLAMVQSGALDNVPQNEYFDQLRAFESALAGAR